ncbi:MAG: hypothetical protein KC657_19270 [Myxococcales bacterium]|nr:hypothetical protein [Myxococcales bacterium]
MAVSRAVSVVIVASVVSACAAIAGIEDAPAPTSEGGGSSSSSSGTTSSSSSSSSGDTSTSSSSGSSSGAVDSGASSSGTPGDSGVDAGPPACTKKPDGQPCTSGAECCNTCKRGRTGPATSGSCGGKCKSVPDFCDSHDDCCLGLYCRGVCASCIGTGGQVATTAIGNFIIPESCCSGTHNNGICT